MPTKILMKRIRKRTPSAATSENILGEKAAKIMSRAVFATGIFSLFSYFFHIEYFPVFELKSAASYISSLAYVLILLITMLALMFLGPYLMAATFIRAKPDGKGNKKLITEIVEWMFWGMLSLCAVAMSVFLSSYMEWPAARGILLALLILVLISSFRAKLIKSRRNRKAPKNLICQLPHRLLSVRKSNWAVSIFWLSTKSANQINTPQPADAKRLRRQRFFTRGIWRMLLVAHRRSSVSPDARLWQRRAVRHIVWTQWLGTLATGVMQFLPLLVLLLTLDRASAIRSDDYASLLIATAWSALGIALVGGILLYFALSSTHRKSWHWALSLMLALPLGLNIMTQASGMLPMAAMQVTKNGNFRAEKLVFSSKACDSIAALIDMDCDAESSKPIELCNVHVMTRVGEETYLRLPERQSDSNGLHRVQRLFVSTKDIVAMDVNFELKFLNLKKLDSNLSRLSSQCISELTTLHSDSAFRFDDFTLTTLGEKTLYQFIENLETSSQSVKEVVITGYADQIGSPSHNAWLSLRRATEVRIFVEKELKKRQMAIKLVVDAKGSGNPVISDCSKAKNRVACEAPNRRVELQIIKKEAANDRPAQP